LYSKGQEIIDNCGRVIFLSGHTHVSPSTAAGSVELDGKNENIYINCGSVVPASIEAEGEILDPSWKDGCITELGIGADVVEVRMRSLADGRYFPRGYYCYYGFNVYEEGR